MRFVGAALAALLTLTGAAQAQDFPQLQFNLERLRLDPSARGSLVMGDGEVLPSEAVRLSATLHYEKRPLVLVQDGDVRGRGVGANRTTVGDFVTERTQLHLTGAIGLFDGIELGAEVPYITKQTGDDPALKESGLAAPWIQLRYGQTKPKPATWGASFAVSPDWGADSQHLNGNKGWSLVPGVEGALRFGRSMLLANASALLRTSDVALTNGEKLHNELHAAVGWATTTRPVRLELTARGQFDLDGVGQDLEVLAAIRYQLGPAELYVLGGPGFFELPGTPSFRGLAGVAFDFGAPPPAEPKPVAAAAPPPPPDPCAPGQKHTPNQCPALDDDGDGVANAQDECPLAKGIPQTHGCPAKDSDGDGVADWEDRCPEQPGVPAEQGCPPARAAINPETKKIDIAEKVYFDTGKATIQERSYKLLDDVAALLAANPSVKTVAIEGHTDDRGPAEYNRTLSQQRAEAVKAYLVGKGVDAARLTPTGYGPDRPAQPNKTAAGREANRRVEFSIKDVEK